MPQISVMIKPASGQCNMKCQYCFYCDEMEKRETASYGFMEDETLEAITKQVLDYGKESTCSFAFQGGEPTLAGLSFFQKAAAFQKKYKTPGTQILNSIQTNGLLLDENWAAFLAENRFLVGLSLDGPAQIHNASRKDAGGRDTFQRVMHAAGLLKKYRIPFTVLSVVTEQNARRTEKIYRFFIKNGLTGQQYIPCIPALGEEPSPWDLTEKAMERHLKTLFQCWFQDAMEGRLYYNRFFMNLIAIIQGGSAESCDLCGICQKQLVVEADGSVYPCDFYVLDRFRLGNLAADSLEQVEEAREKTGFVERSAALKESCRGCRWQWLCRGGCRRYFTPEDDGVSRNRFCGAYRRFFDESYERLSVLAELMRP